MQQSSLRLALRQHTEDIHRRLDAAVGAFHDLSSYGAFVSHSLRFRQMVEPAIGQAGSWEPQSLVAELRLDGDDLSLPAEDEPDAIAPLADDAARLGALYVLEGSALGAHVLFERARALGLGAERGARHLAKQIGAPGRWRQFVGHLDARDDLDRAAVLAGANAVFETAFSIYGGAR